MKTVILSNGNVNIGLNEFGLVSDFYFPDNGYENHTLGEEIFHRIGVKIDDEFSWLNSGEWRFDFRYFSNALISKISATNERLQIRIDFCDFVASDFDAFGRKISVTNFATFPRNVKLFLHQNFSINSGRHLADTVQFLPEIPAILHYRGKRAFVIRAEQIFENAQNNTFRNFDQHTVGLFGIENKIGSWLDAEDGILSGCNVEHGQTDSVIGFDFFAGSGEKFDFQYSISCADGHDLAFLNSQKMSKDFFEKALQKTENSWKNWLKPALEISQKMPEKYREKFIQSVMLVKSHIAKTGAPIASNDSEMLRHARDDYSYCWPRDALFAIWPLVRIGYREEAEKFFEFCAKSVNSKGFMAHKYLPNGEIGPSWHPYSQGGNSKNLPIQIDETAGIVFLFGQYFQKFRDVQKLEEFYPKIIKPMSDFLANFLGENSLPQPNYELWEMDFLSTTYSASVVYSALISASEMARFLDRAQDSYFWRNSAEKLKKSAEKHFWNENSQFFYRGIWPSGEKCEKIDISSFYGAFMFGLFDFENEKISRAFETLQKRFSTEEKIGVPRFENDIYYRFSDDYEANFWPITTLWTAEFLMARGEKQRAEKILDWVAERSSATGILPEQIDPRDLSWKSVAPLTWSQAEFLSTILDFIAQ